MDSDGVAALIGGVYDAALDESAWPRVLPVLGQALDSPKVVLEWVEAGSHAASAQLTLDWDPAVVARYLRDYVQDDPLILDAIRRPHGSVFTDDMLPDYSNYRRGAVYNDIYAPSGAHHVIASFMMRDIGDDDGRSLVLAFRRGIEAGPYSAAERRLFGTVLPHITRSFLIRQRFAGTRLAAGGMGDAMAAMGKAAALVDAEARVVEMNDRARRLLAAADGLVLRTGRIVATAAASRGRLGRLIAATVRATDGAPPPAKGILRVPRPSGRRPYALLVAPVPSRAAWGLSGERLAVVFIHDPAETLEAVQPETVAALHGLTPAEARAAAALASGQSPQGYAASAKLSINTVRWTLKQAMAKTDTNTQAALVRRILSGPVVRTPDADSGPGP